MSANTAVDLSQPTSLTAVSPLDGRYWPTARSLSNYFSELSLMKYRVHVEVEYLHALCCDARLPPIVSLGEGSAPLFVLLRSVVENFGPQQAGRIKEIEKVTNHDIKAVEYFIKEVMEQNGFGQYKEFVHFALTSQDINNTAQPLASKDALNKVYLPEIQTFVGKLNALATQWADVPMLARTHGQPATPTRVGKELAVFVERLNTQISHLSQIKMEAKFGGATGGLNAHYVAYPSIDWETFADTFLTKLGLVRQHFTTQIEHYDTFAAVLDAIKRINVILIDFSRDMWGYISLGYFRQATVKGEVGSSTMPHKVNPIDFENAEGNFGVANAILEHMALKLPISRFQRDLTDSTVLRNVGVGLGHTLVALGSLSRGVGKMNLDVSRINADLDQNWAVVAEAIQTILRREGYPEPYEALKELTRHPEECITQQVMVSFIDKLNVSEPVKEELKRITPHNYIGIMPTFRKGL
ncbi:adenylosuccinate lyase [Pelomyxa schiedti]|nr:adenylosuccinate lyase [Pelomyxa schiedti]